MYNCLIDSSMRPVYIYIDYFLTSHSLAGMLRSGYSCIRREKVIIPASKPYISLIGNQNAARQTDGTVLGTYRSASITNSVNAAVGSTGMLAVALGIAGDTAMFYGVRIVGTQYKLLDDTGSHYFYQSYIE
ncbi:hypothetical protein DCAR_0624333 [Daucus carota subsp. sativus]|uniref:Uncharacterized protein n=1 Tax=Daucus carota subsp. sativus TaxID=79200 RepID=A0AAF0XEM3_DAUCS|nr:hypothetical protein DCAR_0624333 [Daucus carota subsp. sativus]